jgi:hypothetical protein
MAIALPLLPTIAASLLREVVGCLSPVVAQSVVLRTVVLEGELEVRIVSVQL